MSQIHQLDTGDAAVQNTLGGFIAPGTHVQNANRLNNQTICFQLISGVFNAQKHFPLGMARNRSLTIRIEIAPVATAISTLNEAGDAAGLATDHPDYTIQEFYLDVMGFRYQTAII